MQQRDIIAQLTEQTLTLFTSYLHFCLCAVAERAQHTAGWRRWRQRRPARSVFPSGCDPTVATLLSDILSCPRPSHTLPLRLWGRAWGAGIRRAAKGPYGEPVPGRSDSGPPQGPGGTTALQAGQWEEVPLHEGGITEQTDQSVLRTWRQTSALLLGLTEVMETKAIWICLNGFGQQMMFAFGSLLQVKSILYRHFHVTKSEGFAENCTRVRKYPRSGSSKMIFHLSYHCEVENTSPFTPRTDCRFAIGSFHLISVWLVLSR